MRLRVTANKPYPLFPAWAIWFLRPHMTEAFWLISLCTTTPMLPIF